MTSGGIHSDIESLYHAQECLGLEDIPATCGVTHTMGSAVDSYVLQRLPTDIVESHLREGAEIEIHGIHPDHVRVVRSASRTLHRGHQFGPGKAFNVIRPRLFIEPGTLLLAVPPGRDYLLHNASIIRHYLAMSGFPPQRLRQVVRYPEAEDKIASWTQLADLVRPGDRVLLGYVAELVAELRKCGGTVIAAKHNASYGAVRLRLPGGEEVCALGVKFSFWGCISARLVRACARLGAHEVIYAGKLGTLTAPSDIYSRLFVPSSYLEHSRQTRLLSRQQAPPNGLLSRFPHLDSGLHMSVATVLEEDVDQRVMANAYGVSSVDNEIAQMAWAIGDADTATQTAFSALHFATDYLRQPRETELPGIFNLTNHRSTLEIAKKHQMVKRIGAVLRDYYECGPVHRNIGAMSATKLAID